MARRVRERVKRSLEQLPKNAITLLCRSAVYRRSVPKLFWLGMIGDYSSEEQNKAYQILCDRALVEKEKDLLRQHNLIRDIAYDWLREDEEVWKNTELKAAELWLNEYKTADNVENLEKVRGYLEAFYHYCNVEDWEKAKQIFKTRLEITKTQELHNQLWTWGYYTDTENNHLCNFLLNKLDPRIDVICYKELAQIYYVMGNFGKAIDYYEKGLIIAKKIDDFDCQLALYNGLTQAYIGLGMPREAINILEKVIEENIDLCKRDSFIYNTLGNAYFSLKEIKKSWQHYETSLDIARKINNDHGIATACINLAKIYGYLGNIEEFEKYRREAESILERTEDHLGITNLKIIVGMILCCQGKDSDGIKLWEEALKRCKEKKYLKKEMDLSCNLAIIYDEIGQSQLARQHCEQALAIATDLGIPLAQECQKLLLKTEEKTQNNNR